MGKSESRPRASAEPMNLKQSKKLLEKLLKIELHRLDVAVRIEKERNIVFPETTTETYSGLGKSHRLMLLQEGMKYQKVGSAPKDSQFIELRKYQKPVKPGRKREPQNNDE